MLNYLNIKIIAKKLGNTNNYLGNLSPVRFEEINLMLQNEMAA